MPANLSRLFEDWRKALDNHQSAAAVLMDLSKAFDCLPDNLLIEKLRAYGLAQVAINLLSSYLSDRVQQVRLGSHTSTWENIIKGVPQGSVESSSLLLHSYYAPNFEKSGGILVSVCPCVCVWGGGGGGGGHRDIVLKLHVWIPQGKIAKAYFWFSLNYLPLLNYGPLTIKGMKFCKCRISKSIIARNLKLVMLIGDDD